MSKANRTCYCCGREYYYCPSCPGERKNPSIYTMWDSELCKDIFNVLVSESTKKITTSECKNKLIDLGVNKNTVLKDAVRTHVDRVMSHQEVEVEVVVNQAIEETQKVEKLIEEFEEVKDNTSEEIVLHDINTDCVEIESIEEVKETFEMRESKRKSKARKNSFKNKENSEVD